MKMMFRKNKITETQKARIQTSNCRSCGWRVPVDRNAPVSCLWGVMDIWDINACNCRAKCDRYISDIALERHLKMLLKYNDHPTEKGGEQE